MAAGKDGLGGREGACDLAKSCVPGGGYRNENRTEQLTVDR